MAKPSVVIAGSTGLVGNELRKLLPDALEIGEVIAISRAPLEDLPPRAKNVIVDFNRLEETLPAFAADIFICCLGTTLKIAGSAGAFRKVDYGYVLDFARCAQKSGARKFLMLSAIGADASSPFLYSQTKGKIEEAVARLKIPEIQIFRPSLLLGDRGESFLSKAIFFGPFKKYRSIGAAVVARALIRAALHPSSPGVTIYESNEIARMGEGV